MSITISSNQAASYSALNMKRANNLLTKSLQRLSSGKRIVSPADDAGGLAVGMKLQSSLKRAAASKMNTQNGVSFLQMQDSVLKVSGEILDRMSELKSFFNDVSKGADDRETYNHEFNELQKELNALKAQKFNGVSLFATHEPDSNPLKIITSDDGLGEHIELTRTGFFENLKSKFGADGKLDSGSHGEYRQLVGDFSTDGGIFDADPGYSSKSYSAGEVVYKQGVSLSDSGYFMALKNVTAGTKIIDEADANSLWIRIADKGGVGFAESYPDAPEYNQYNTQFNSKGEPVAYLKGDKVKIPAHWASPGSNLFLEAQSDVPQGITLYELFSNGYVTSDKTGYFQYVGDDSNGSGIKPTTEFVRANSNLSEPTNMTANSASSLKYAMSIAGSSANYVPSFIKSGTTIYQATHDWEAKTWNDKVSFKEGEIYYNKDGAGDKYVGLINSNVKGTYTGAYATANDYVFYQGKWYQAAQDISAQTAPVDPDDALAPQATTKAYVSGDAVSISGTIYSAPGTFAGNFDSDNIAFGKWVRGDTNGAGAMGWHQLADDAATQFGASYKNDFNREGTYALNDVVKFEGDYYIATAAADGSGANADLSDPDQNASFRLVSFADLHGTFNGTLKDSTVGTTGWNNANIQAKWTQNYWIHESDPAGQADYATDITADVSNPDNEKYWAKTHFANLEDKTVSTSYTRGDNIYYQGKHYVYTSHLDSDNPSFVDPTNDGYTEFETLLRLGAITELPMYVDTIGGGGANLPEGVYYRPDQDLEFVDRLPNTGLVRTNSIERRTDAPLPPGDEIFNSQDDQFYGGLNAGNDGIYGTMDDFYASTDYSNRAKAGGHIDADADNNKDLLDDSLGLQDFSVADFVDYIQNLANVRAVNGGTMSRLGYAQRILEENEINLGAATSRIMDADMAYESTRMATHNVLLQAAASMVTQANSLNNVVLSLLQ